MQWPDYVQRTRQVFVEAGAIEEDRAFRAILWKMAGTGLQWGSILGIIGILVLVVAHSLLLGRPTSWWYPEVVAPEHFVLWDKIVALVLCVGAFGIGRARCRLSVIRMAGLIIAVTVVAVAFTHDAFRGALSIEYFTLVYLLGVVVVPYRPGQALFLGVALGTVFFIVAEYGIPGTQAAMPTLVEPRHLVHAGFVTVVLTGVAGLLYATRYHQYQARKEAETLRDEVAHLERAKSRFFADISHEFRTPLTLILSPLQEALGDRLGPVPAPLRERLEGMKEQGRRLQQLVNQLLELAKLDEGHMPLSVQRHDLAALIDRIVPPFRDWADNEGIALHSEVAFERLDVWVDADRFEQIIANLLSNAIQYTPAGGTIRVRALQSNGHAELSVRDTGPGLPETLRERVFDRYESRMPVSDAPTPDPTASGGSDTWIGMGIGLALTKALIERHRGSIVVNSEPGFGTEFTLRWPLGRDHIAEDDLADVDRNGGRPGESGIDVETWKAPHVPATSDPPVDRAQDEAPEILVVDDDPYMRNYFQQLLGQHYHVATANDGDTGLERIRDRLPDLVISDVVMPGRDGFALCRAIRDDERLRHLPVILLTSRKEDEARLTGLQAGADAYVSKPFDPDELAARVENLIEIRRVVQERIRLPDWMQPKVRPIPSEDATFVEELYAAVEAHVDNSNFGVDWLADEMDLSSRHLQRRVKELTRLSAAGFIRTVRLRHAAALLQQGADTISDVAAAVGYRDASYFSRLFRETFGCPPSEYAASAQDDPDPSDM